MRFGTGWYTGNAETPCGARLFGIGWYGLVRPDMAFGQIQVLYRPPQKPLEPQGFGGFLMPFSERFPLLAYPVETD